MGRTASGISCRGFDPHEDTERAGLAPIAIIVLEVAEASIRTRILKVRYRQVYDQYLKPVAEASIRTRILKAIAQSTRRAGSWSCRGFDPHEDTERLRWPGWSDRASRVAEASIRTRILKAATNALDGAVEVSCRGFDPHEDTERMDLIDDDGADALLQRLRSARGY